MSKPLIGITLNVETRGEADGGYSDYPWYAMRCDYAKAVADAGGIPVHIGHDLSVLDDYLERFDGFVLTGGDIDSPAAVYKNGLPSNYNPDHPRLKFEFELIRRLLKQDIPTFGICAGMQHMNIALGGTLYPDVVKNINTKIKHKDLERHKPKHLVEIDPDSQLAEVMGVNEVEVNSNHREAINKLVNIFNISARAADGVIEAIEVNAKKFFIGVQWHPEFRLSEAENKLWRTFVDAATV